jgi:hypothetical protein
VTSPQTKTRRCAKLLFFLLLMVAAVWWSLWFPFNEEKLRLAIPGDSTLIAEIQSPGARWDAIRANPLVAAFLPGTVETGAPSAADANTRRIAFLVRWLAPTRALLAYVPEYASSDRPAWVAASWSGHRAQLFRWALGINLVPGFHAERTNYGHTFWVLRLPDETMPFLSVDVSDGIILACVSRHRDGVRELVRRMEFHAPPAPLFRSFAIAQNQDVTNLIARAVLATAGHAQSPEALLSATLTAFDADRVAGAAVWHQPALLPLAVPPAARLASALDWLGPDVCLTLHLPTTTNRPLNWLGSSLSPVWRTALASLDRTATTNAAVFAALLGGECSGRMLGLRVPTMVIGIQCNPSTELGDPVRLGLDILNSTYAWGLIPMHREVAGTPMITVEASRPCLLNAMADRERPALALHKDWLIFCSNADVLERLLTAGPPPAGEFRQGRDARLWIDFSRTAQCLRHALAVYELSLLRGEETAGSRAARRQVEHARSWIEALSAFAIGDVAVHSSPHGTQLEFELRR